MASVPSSTEPTTVTTTAISAASEGPVLSVLTKRIRALRKKLNSILQMEQSLSQGKQLNPEQLEVVRSKPALLTLIDEVEKLRAPISAALDEELSVERNNGVEERNNVVEDMVDLMYFGSLFDVKQQSESTSLLTKTHERECCLTYDCVTVLTDDDAFDVDLLEEKDLDLISEVLGLMTAKPVNSTLSHQNAVQRCLKHAKLWTAKSDQPVLPQSDVTYAMLREKLNKIMSSGYYTATPQMKGPVEVAAAAAVSSFGSFPGSKSESAVEHDDGFKWRKYGEKVNKGQTHRSSYYRCTVVGCIARKIVQRSIEDPKEVVTIYKVVHVHPDLEGHDKHGDDVGGTRRSSRIRGKRKRDD